MDGSDDYFGDDDFVLDEKTLAVLDLEEKKWQQQQTQAGQRRPVSQEARLPSPKRRKTSHDVTPEGLIPQIRAVTVGDDYDEDLPDISIIGNGLYNLPAAQRASLAAQAQGGQSNHASTSNRHPPPRVPAQPPRAAAPLAPQRRASSGSGSAASGSGQSQGQPASSRPPQRNRVPRQHSTLSSVQAALANFVPPATNVPAPTPPARPPLSRVSPAPGPSRVAPSAPVRPTVRTPPIAAPPRATRGASPSVSVLQGRRQSIPAAGPSWQQQQRVSPSIPPQPPPPLQPAFQPPLSQGQNQRNLQIEVETLRAQVQELLKAQQKTESDLEEARNARYAKEGEVSILRKSIEKAAKDHAAEVARIKSAKEEAEAMQVQIRKEMREELERVKTQYLFKQHELETSARKTPWSSKIKRIELPATQRKQVSEEQQLTLQTPSRPSASAVVLTTSPERQHRKKIIHIPESPPEKPPRLRGFFNAFESTPSHLRLSLSQAAQSTQVGRKGKERAKPTYDFSEAQNEDLFFNPPPTQDEFQYQEPSSQPIASAAREPQDEIPMQDVQVEPQPRPSPPASSADPVVTSEQQDVEMKESEKKNKPEPEPEPLEPADPLLNPDWTRELERIILTHRHRTIERSTLQQIIDFELPSAASPEQMKAYSTQIMRLLDDLGTFAARPSETEHALREVTSTLCSIGQILCDTQSISPLAALVDVMKMLALLIGPYVPTVLASSGDPMKANSPPEILEFLNTVIRSTLNPRKHEQGEDRSALAAECLGLLEAISWYTPPDLVMRLTYFVRAPDILDILVDPKQPISLVQKLARILALLASYQDVYKYLLTLETSEDADAEVEQYRLRYLEKLAMMLVDRQRNGLEYQPLRKSIIHLLSALVSHDDPTIRAILVQSDIIVPAIIHFTHYLTDPLYEEDEEFLESPQLVTWSIDILGHVIPLLDRVLKDTEFESIRYKLVNLDSNQKKKTFAGVFHMITVALGRVGFAEVPTQLSAEDYRKLDELHLLAKHVLEYVVDGPEIELMWEAFQTQTTESPVLRPKQRHKDQNRGDEDIES